MDECVVSIQVSPAASAPASGRLGGGRWIEVSLRSI